MASDDVLTMTEVSPQLQFSSTVLLPRRSRFIGVAFASTAVDDAMVTTILPRDNYAEKRIYFHGKK